MSRCRGTRHLRRANRHPMSPARPGPAAKLPLRARPHRLAAKDTTLSRWRHGFEPRWGCQSVHNPNRVQRDTKRRVDVLSVFDADPFRQRPDQGLPCRCLAVRQHVSKVVTEGGKLGLDGPCSRVLVEPSLDHFTAPCEFRPLFGERLDTGSKVGLDSGETVENRRTPGQAWHSAHRALTAPQTRQLAYPSSSH